MSAPVQSPADLRLGADDRLPRRQVRPAARVDRPLRREYLAPAAGPARRPGGPFDPPLCEYPPSDYAALVAAAAAAYGVAPDEFLPTAGADEALDLTARAFLREGSVAVVATPTYAMYRIVSEQRGASVVAVPRLGPEDAFRLDIPALAEAGRHADLVWLCEPNNPTGACRAAGAHRRAAGPARGRSRP